MVQMITATTVTETNQNNLNQTGQKISKIFSSIVSVSVVNFDFIKVKAQNKKQSLFHSPIQSMRQFLLIYVFIVSMILIAIVYRQ